MEKKMNYQNNITIAFVIPTDGKTAILRLVKIVKPESAHHRCKRNKKVEIQCEVKNCNR
jgi:hypothetical protein